MVLHVLGCRGVYSTRLYQCGFQEFPVALDSAQKVFSMDPLVLSRLVMGASDRFNIVFRVVHCTKSKANFTKTMVSSSTINVNNNILLDIPINHLQLRKTFPVLRANKSCMLVVSVNTNYPPPRRVVHTIRKLHLLIPGLRCVKRFPLTSPVELYVCLLLLHASFRVADALCCR